MHLASLPPESEDIYVTTKYQLYLQQNNALHDLTYPTYFQWWRKSTYNEQLKAEKSVKKGLLPAMGYKGVDEFEELKASMVNLESKLERLNDELESKSHLWSAVQSIMSASAEHDSTALVIKQNLKNICNNMELESNSSETELAECNAILRDIGLFNSSTNRPEKLHWLHIKLLQAHNNDEIPSTPMYIMLENHPPGSMVPDQNGTYWVRRATAAVTRHRFITVEDQETYYEQKYLLTVPLTSTDSIITKPPSSWVRAAMEGNLVDEHHDARATLMDAVKRGFSLENNRSIVKMYIENQF